MKQTILDKIFSKSSKDENIEIDYLGLVLSGGRDDNYSDDIDNDKFVDRLYYF